MPKLGKNLHMIYMTAYVVTADALDPIPETGRGQDKILSWYILLDRYKISGRRLEILVR